MAAICTQERKLNSTKQESLRINISEKTMVKGRSTGVPNIPYIKIGKTVRYDPDVTDAWLIKQSRGV